MEDITVQDVFELRQRLNREICTLDISKYLYNVDLASDTNTHFMSVFWLNKDKPKFFENFELGFFGFSGRVRALEFKMELDFLKINYTDSVGLYGPGVLLSGAEFQRMVHTVEIEQCERFRDSLFARENAPILYSTYEAAYRATLPDRRTGRIRIPNRQIGRIRCGHTVCMTCVRDIPNYRESRCPICLMNCLDLCEYMKMLYA